MINPISNLIYNYQAQASQKVPQKVYIETVQKSGTHLLTKICTLLQIEQKYMQDNNLKWNHLASRLKMINQGKKLNNIFSNDKKFLILYRDPRDLIVSQIFHRMKPKLAYKLTDHSDFNNYSMSQLIDKSLKHEKTEAFTIGSYAKNLFQSLEMALILKKNPSKNRLLVRFEDLVPSFAGGPNFKKRLRIFKGICDFAEKTTSDKIIHSAMKKCWGDKGGTFRKEEKKKVGQWQKYFEPHHIKLFQEKYNHLLIGLGYEKDQDWHLKYLENENTCEV